MTAVLGHVRVDARDLDDLMPLRLLVTAMQARATTVALLGHKVDDFGYLFGWQQFALVAGMSRLTPTLLAAGLRRWPRH